MLTLTAALACFASFGWGMAVHFKRSGRPSPLLICIALSAPLATLAQIGILATQGTHEPILAVHILPLVIYALGAATFWWAVSATRGMLAPCGSPPVCAKLVVSGPYRWVRHPFYVSYILVWIAGFVAAPSGVTALTVLVMTGLYARSAWLEERAILAGPLAADWKRYRRRTPALFPRLTAGHRQ